MLGVLNKGRTVRSVINQTVSVILSDHQHISTF